MSIKLYEVESPDGSYHQHWLASGPRDAAQRAFDHAPELGLEIRSVGVSSMVEPERPSRGGLVYVLNDTQIFIMQGKTIRKTSR